ncbi:Protein phosphatase 1 regulatory subunit 16A [Clonorchis sinensis]|uniref:Protein phosphatase 1 regulatory subunit 16A n=1 Tax=Clonorchis sinensis TaxID=79923 RepID=A0A8T1LZW5_CLOSI|nr:Protein phosphatase 1 regulatory subunit 16A [Clonorchis sinensis]
MMDGSSAFEMNGSIASEAPQTRVPDLERIRNARNKRKLQLKDWHQYDRKMMREAEKLQRKGLSPPSERGFHRAGHSVKFPPSLIFLEAAARGDLDEVRKLLSNGVCPDVANEDGLTALHQCCIDNTPEMCRLLLRFGANPNARDSEGWTPLHAAATCLHTDLCAILIAKLGQPGSIPALVLPSGGMAARHRKGVTAEQYVVCITQEELDDLHRLPECKMLADMEEMYKAGADFNQLDQQGAAMLHIAAACGYEEVTIFLLKHGAKIDLTDRDGWQAIHIAACWDHLEIIEVLVNFGADIMAETTSGETVFDICEDLEIHSRLIELKQEMERKQTQQLDSLSRTERPRELVRRRSSTNPRSASIRRTSMREKKMISWKEAKQEAEMRGITPINLGEGETPESDAEQVKQRQQQEPIQLPVDVNFERRVTSPLTVSISNDKSKPDVTSSVIRSPSPSGQPSSTACVSSPQTKRVTALTSPPLLSGPGRLSNGVTSPVSGRPPSRLQDRNSARPQRSDKALKTTEQIGTDLTRKGSEKESGNTRRLSPKSDLPNNAVPATQTRSTQKQYVTTDVQSTGSVSPVSRSRPRQPTDRYTNLAVTNGSGGGASRNRDLNVIVPSPQVARRSTSSLSRKKMPEQINIKPELNLSAHNAYMMPPPSTPHPSTSEVTNRNTTGSLPRSHLTRTVSGHHSTHMVGPVPRKNTKELIAYDSDPRNSGKCCVLM